MSGNSVAHSAVELRATVQLPDANAGATALKSGGTTASSSAVQPTVQSRSLTTDSDVRSDPDKVASSNTKSKVADPKPAPVQIAVAPRPVSVLWYAPLFSGGGYGSEAISFITHLDGMHHPANRARVDAEADADADADAPVAVSVTARHSGDAVSAHFYAGLPAALQSRLSALATRPLALALFPPPPRPSADTAAAAPPAAAATKDKWRALASVPVAAVVCHVEPGAFHPPRFSTEPCPPLGAPWGAYARAAAEAAVDDWRRGVALAQEQLHAARRGDATTAEADSTGAALSFTPAALDAAAAALAASHADDADDADSGVTAVTLTSAPTSNWPDVTPPALLPAASQSPYTLPAVLIARTMFESDRLPHGWPARLARFDWVWVPSDWSRSVFLAAGVAPGKVRVVP